jgi:hypothetical protein
MLEIIFGWIFSWATILVLATTGLGVMSMSPPACCVARVLITTATVILLGKIGILAISTEPIIWKRIVSIFIIFGIVGAIWVEAMCWINDRELLLIYGILTPDNKPTPTPAVGKIPANGIALYFGNSVTYTTHFPQAAIRLDNIPLIIIDKNKDRITISGNFYSKDRKIVAELKNNKFIVNPQNYFKVERPNFHQLIVYDQYNNKILDVEIINQSVIKILGTYYLPNPHLPPIVIDNNYLQYGNTKINSCCMDNGISLLSNGLFGF